jgi:outer membrane lipoprotein
MLYERTKMNSKGTRKYVWTLVVLFSVGCASGISQQSRSQVTYDGTFSNLQKTPAEYVGEVVLLGGRIIENKPSPGGSELLVLHLPTDGQGRPKDDDQSQGRYLIQSEQFLDPAIYEEDARLSVVGKLVGSEVRPIGSLDYVYPKLEAIEVKLWPETSYTYPRFHIGIGVGKTF